MIKVLVGHLNSTRHKHTHIYSGLYPNWDVCVDDDLETSKESVVEGNSGGNCCVHPVDQIQGSSICGEED
jgi:hypothetical protein